MSMPLLRTPVMRPSSSCSSTSVHSISRRSPVAVMSSCSYWESTSRRPAIRTRSPSRLTLRRPRGTASEIQAAPTTSSAGRPSSRQAVAFASSMRPVRSNTTIAAPETSR
jgi:hypothetical protein